GGVVRFTTNKGTRKLRLMREYQRVALCVQLAESPYMYVTVEGPVTKIEAADVERDMRPIAYRYLGAYNGERYIESLGGEAAADNSVLVCMRPERWYSADYS
ncbi:MAG: hypothetical protein R3293_22035, partial [Candidatus Promineifilaceae bacterium]|nr:hypothetical protein [Candidatus Promineifilaceae bacterium]